MVRLRAGERLLDRFELVEEIGHGGYSVVWRATDSTLNRSIALKRLTDSDATNEAIAEARHLASLTHSNIVQIFDVFEVEGFAYLVMEYVEGQSLSNLLKGKSLDGDWITVDEGILFFDQIAEALAHAHRNSILHRDIKPENILISQIGEAKLTDFGIARQETVQNGFGTTNNSPVVGARTGTMEYMSPEQLRGDSLTYQSDVFSLGLVAFLLLSRRHPFNHPTGLFAISDLIKDGSYEPPFDSMDANVPEPIVELVRSMLLPDVGQRIESAEDVLSTLRLARQVGMTCEHCGVPNATESLFCSQCGTSLRNIDEVGNSDAVELTNVGYAAAQAGEWRAAIAKYEEAIAVDSSYARAYGNLGYALNRVGRHEDAIAILTEAMDIQEHPSCYDYRAFALSKLRRNDEAVQDLQRALELSPGNINYMLHLARVLMFNDDFTDAEEILSEIISRDPNNPKAMLYQQQLLERTEA